MPNILVIAESGFGKTTSLIENKQYGIKGLNPDETYVISATKKDLPGRGSRHLFPILPPEITHTGISAGHLAPYRRIITNNAMIVAHMIRLLATVQKIKNVVLDDANYIMQDYYMAKALSTGWDAPKRIGYDMGQIFEAFNNLRIEQNFIMLAHGEEYDKADNKKGYRVKTTGKMVQEYITPEGKFDVVLIGRSNYDDTSRKVSKEFVTNDDGTYTSAKSHGIFDSLYIPNDMGLVIEKVTEYFSTMPNKDIVEEEKPDSQVAEETKEGETK